MKIKYKYLPLLVLLTTLIWGCKKEEISAVDPMVNGINIQALKTAENLNSSSWGNALIGLREQRIKLFGVKKLIAENKYNGDKYTLKDPALATKQADETLVIIDFKIDSLFKANIKNDFDAINPESAGIKNFGLLPYNAAKTKLATISLWLKSEATDNSLSNYVANDFVEFQTEIAALTALNALNEAEVLAFVSDIKTQLATMKQQYADLANPVATSPFFTKAQKALYTSINQPLLDVEVVINTKLDFATKVQLDAVNRDLQALAYFVANNYTSPAQKPIVFGKISSITELRWFSEVSTNEERTGDWELTVDIDAAETKRWNPSTPEPGFTQISKFNGTFDGKNHFVSGIFMTHATGGKAGFFNDVSGSTIQNFGVVNIYINGVAGGGGQGGSLIGYIANGKVLNCFSTGTMLRNNQSGGFLGRTAGEVTIEDCFSSVNTPAGAGDVSNSSSFLGLPTGGLRMNNVYTTGANPTRVFFGFASGLKLREASGIYYDPVTVGNTNLDNNGYSGQWTTVRLAEAGIVTAVPTAQWNSLSNFPGLASSKWEIKTVTEIDANPRPYLKAFNYDLLKDFITP